jgi:hypothetical protein
MQCYVCERPVSGNLDKDKAIKCAVCLNGEVEYIRNHPEEYPEAFAKKKRPIVSLRRKNTKQPKGTTLSTC